MNFLTSQCSSCSRNGKLKFGKTPKQYFTKVVFPLPEGAENIITLFINMLDGKLGAGSLHQTSITQHPTFIIRLTFVL